MDYKAIFKGMVKAAEELEAQAKKIREAAEYFNGETWQYVEPVTPPAASTPGMKARAKQVMQSFKRGTGRFSVLDTLAEEGGLSVDEIAKRGKTTLSAVSGALYGNARGYFRREIRNHISYWYLSKAGEEKYLSIDSEVVS